MASYTEAARVAPARPERARQRPQTRPKAAPGRRARKRGVTGGALWIGVVAVLLSGVVALNVAVLRLNIRLDGVAQERAKLRATNQALASQLSSAEASPRVQELAARRLGLVPADPLTTTFVHLGSRAR
jgi:hypothetical protein